MEPAKISRIYFNGWGDFATSYSWNPYMNIFRTGEKLINLTFVPPHIRGDRDFHGNGPRITIEARLRILKDSIEAWVYMDALEWKGRKAHKDYTQARGVKDWSCVYKAPAGREITHVGCSTAPVKIVFTDTDHEPDTILGPSDGFVQSFEIVGDTKGDEAGTRTKVEVRFHHLNVKTRPVRDQPPEPVPPRSRIVHDSIKITTGPRDARLRAGDWELDTDDWTLLEVSYSTKITNHGRSVDLTIKWHVVELEKNQGYKSGNTQIQSDKTIRIWQQPPNSSRIVKEIVKGGSGSFSKHVPGEVHGPHMYESFGGFQSPTISFDGKGRNDGDRQSFSGRLQWSYKLVGN